MSVIEVEFETRWEFASVRIVHALFMPVFAATCKSLFTGICHTVLAPGWIYLTCGMWMEISPSGSWSGLSVLLQCVLRDSLCTVCGTALGAVHMYVQAWQRSSTIRVLSTFRKHVLKWFDFTSFKGVPGCLLGLCKPGLVAIGYTVLFSTQTVLEVWKSCCSFSV